MVADALNLLRSLVFFAGLLIANIYIVLQRKVRRARSFQEEAEGTAV